MSAASVPERTLEKTLNQEDHMAIALKCSQPHSWAISLTFLLSFGSFIEAHNWLTAPVSRTNQALTETGCRYGGEGGPTCSGPCDARLGSPGNVGVTAIKRGDEILVSWNRHNHPGGFIRLAWASTSNSDSHAAFDEGIDRFLCKEAGGCGPSDLSNPDNSPTNGQSCTTTITVPEHLQNGFWTLQWAYFGGYYNAGDYYACVDYQVTSGPSGPRPETKFYGGDITYPTEQACKFYQTNALHVCSQEPCDNGTIPGGPHKGAPLGFEINTPPSSVSSSSTTGEQSETCYKDGTLNIEGPINYNPPSCGSNSANNARCPDEQCCSQYGFCGPVLNQDGQYHEEVDGQVQVVDSDQAFSIYCTNNQGDWRTVTCEAEDSAALHLQSLSVVTFWLCLLGITINILG